MRLLPRRAFIAKCLIFLPLRFVSPLWMSGSGPLLCHPARPASSDSRSGLPPCRCSAALSPLAGWELGWGSWAALAKSCFGAIACRYSRTCPGTPASLATANRQEPGRPRSFEPSILRFQFFASNSSKTNRRQPLRPWSGALVSRQLRIKLGPSATSTTAIAPPTVVSSHWVALRLTLERLPRIQGCNVLRCIPSLKISE
jgi:hypothetical protein